MYTPYEMGNQYRGFGVAFGRIVSVNVKERVCSVCTFGAGVNSNIEDNYIERCQWLSADANPEGDECGSIPRRGSLGLVFFVNGEPFIWGYLRPLWKGGTAGRSDSTVTLVEGDKIISTLQGNRITVKRSGLIEMYTADTLRRAMMPNGSRILDICREYNLNCMNGGQITWSSDELDSALFKAEYRRDLARSFMVVEEKGYVTSDILSRVTIGPALPFFPDIQTPTYVQTIATTGEVTTTVTPPMPPGSPVGYASVIGPDGSISIKAGSAQTVSIEVSALGDIDISTNELASVSISKIGDIDVSGPIGSASISAQGDIALANAIATAAMTAAGDIEFSNAMAKLSVSSTGDIEISGPTCTFKMTAAGEVTVEAPQKVTIEGKLGVDIKSLGPVNIEGVGPMSIKTKGIIALDGGTGASDFVLTNPTTISPFTGAPLAPFSTTIQVSK